MPAVSASAPGKIILFGEHAVVYGRPAIAIPVEQVHAKAVVSARIGAPQGEVRFDAPDIRLEAPLDALPADHPLALAVRGVQTELGVSRLPAMHIRITSSIPIAAGLGSGAAVSVALIRALAGFLGAALPDERVNTLAYTVEQRLHGTPSGIDNTVITYRAPIFFQRGQPFELLHCAAPLTFVIGDTGIHSLTGDVVEDVRAARESQPEVYDALFDQVGALARTARAAIETGNAQTLAGLMNTNHALLQRIGVSCGALDALVQAALDSGANGAKLSGGGRGGNMIALVRAEDAPQVAAALAGAGAVRTIITTLRPAAKDSNR